MGVRADEIDVAVLMFNGAIDFDIGLQDHSAVPARRLDRAGKDVVLIEYPQSRHDITRGPDRVDMLARIRALLSQEIGPPIRNAEISIAP